MVERKLIEVSLIENLKPGDLFIPILENERVPDYAQETYVGLPYTHEIFMLIGPAEKITRKERSMTAFLGVGPIAVINVSTGLVYSLGKKDNIIAIDIPFCIDNFKKDQYLQNVIRLLGINIPKKIIFCQEGFAFDVSDDDDLFADADRICVRDKRNNFVGYIEATAFEEGFKDLVVQKRPHSLDFNGYIDIDKSDDSLWLIVEGVGEERRVPIKGPRPKNIAIGKGVYRGIIER